MATGRTVSRWTRLYADGFDLSSNTMSIGPLMWEYDPQMITGLDWSVNGALPDQATLGIGTLNGIFDSTATSGLHIVASGAGVSRTVLVPIGIRSAPAQGDPAYVGVFNQNDYQAVPANGMTTVSIPFGMNTPVTALNYQKPWGVLLHPKGEETAANTAVGVDDYGAATAAGGYLVYQIFSITGSGTVTISVDDAATNTNPSFSALSGATSGAIATASAPIAGIVQLSVTATVRRYLRWQIAFGGSASACNFALAFVRG